MVEPPTPAPLATVLARAAAARAARVDLTRRITTGEVSFAEVLDGDDEVAGSLKVTSVLESLRGVGKVAARRAMVELGIATDRRVRGLEARQRQALLAQFGG
jgi:ABC-type sugar transport system substrate-binding protein